MWSKIRAIIVAGSGLLLASASGWPAIIVVPDGGNFQTALNNAQPGDTIVLAARAIYNTSGGFKLPNKGSSTQFITIQSSELNALPAADYRVHPSDAGHMPKLVSNINSAAVVFAEAGAHHYQFIGIEFAVHAGNWSSRMVEFGDGSETSVSQLPHDMIVDRCYIHGDTIAPGTKRGVQMNGINLSLLNSYISEIHVVGQDAQAASGANGPGPFKIINNYLEASGENVLFGGADPAIPNLVISDVEVRNNYMFKPLSWQPASPTYAGIHWSCKNIFELKNAQRVLVDGNIFENNWQGDQPGPSIVFTPRNQDGGAPWTVVKDVTFTHNIVRHVAAGVNILGSDNIHPSLQTQNIVVRDNLFDDIDATHLGNGRIFQASAPGPALNITFDHNTGIHTGSGNTFFYVGDSGIVLSGFRFTNNLVTHASFGFFSNVGAGTAALNQYTTNTVFQKNTIIGGGRASDYPANNAFAADLAAVKFTNLAAKDYRLAASSLYKDAGTDGKDIGADIAAVYAATCGTLVGIPVSACSTYVPPPLPGPGPLPAPTLNLPPYIQVNARIQATLPPQYPVTSYNWTITPLTTSSIVPAAAIQSNAGSATFSTPSGVADLAPRGLLPGSYRISVMANDSSGNVSPVTQRNITLVEADLSVVRVYPNPWRSDRHAIPRITFDRLTVNSSVKIFTVSGRFVKTLPTASDTATWDLTNEDGDRVASGLYLYLIKADQGQKKTGKLAIIR